jgi:hypothetical protein
LQAHRHDCVPFADYNFVGGNTFSSPVLAKCLVEWLNYIGEPVPKLVILSDAAKRENLGVYIKEVAYVIGGVSAEGQALMKAAQAGRSCRSERALKSVVLTSVLYVECGIAQCCC